jgi:hypothetical protein
MEELFLDMARHPETGRIFLLVLFSTGVITGAAVNSVIRMATNRK